jgi:hypothetical protein
MNELSEQWQDKAWLWAAEAEAVPESLRPMCEMLAAEYARLAAGGEHRRQRHECRRFC